MSRDAFEAYSEEIEIRWRRLEDLSGIHRRRWLASPREPEIERLLVRRPRVLAAWEQVEHLLDDLKAWGNAQGDQTKAALDDPRRELEDAR